MAAPKATDASSAYEWTDIDTNTTGGMPALVSDKDKDNLAGTEYATATTTTTTTGSASSANDLPPPRRTNSLIVNHRNQMNGNVGGTGTETDGAGSETAEEGDGDASLTGQRSNEERRSPTNGNDNEEENETASQDSNAPFLPSDLRFYVNQLTLILVPVIFCIILSILWTKLARSPDAGGYAPSSFNYISGGTTDSGSSGSPLEGLGNAMIILSQIIVATIIILVLFKYGCLKILYGFFALVVLVLLGLFGYLLLAALLTRLNIPMDWITFALCIWNLAVVGLISIFWKGPLWIQQSYLVVMSSLMAFSFTGLDEWTTWLLLGLLALWDLFAVLTPWGPLRLLIESSRNENREIPALLYSAAVWFMASLDGTDGTDGTGGTGGPQQEQGGNSDPSDEDLSAVWASSSTSPPTTEQQQPAKANKAAFPESPADSLSDFTFFPANDPSNVAMKPVVVAPGTATTSNGTTTSFLSAPPADDTTDAASVGATSTTPILANPTDLGNPRHPRSHPLSGILSQEEIDGQSPPGEALPSYRTAASQPPNQPDELEDEEDAARSGLKLGLGDFVFYSVMCSRAAMRDWVTTIAVSLSAISGLISTIFLLVMFRKALPALPISIALGIIFYFGTTAVIVPWCLEGLYGGVPWNANMAGGMKSGWEGEGDVLTPGLWTGGVVYT